MKNDSLKLLGSYMAGLIEGEGAFHIPDINLPKRTPYIRICFNIQDKIFAEFLHKLLNFGSLSYHSSYIYFSSLGPVATSMYFA